MDGGVKLNKNAPFLLFGIEFAINTNVMKRALLNGKDINIDIDFFKELGAVEYFDAGSVGNYNRKNFRDGLGNLFFAGWLDNDYTIRITCEGFKLGENERKEKELLNNLNMCLLGLNLEDVTYRSGVFTSEGEHPMLRIAFFQK